ncbi:DsrE family protein [Methanogenium organophilum]|uniref:DsrE family protein n=1 Tax=Methanogenium organophilum TaxID=2199 RepID=A0A9X9S577_METOG|nr:DsrE family protein [Methanogenium organophilum]WAI01717.1 DsrE family protein [Methanogenium organophilum]
MVKTINAQGIRSPNAAILADNVIKNLDDTNEEVRFILSPGAEEGMENVAHKHGYTLEVTKSGNLIEAGMIPSGKTMKEINVTGDVCPGPVITVGNIIANLTVGERIKVIAASQETLDDITMAIQSSGSGVIGQGTEGELHYLIAEKAEKQEAASSAVVSRDRVVIAQSNGIGNAERAYATFLFSQVALSMGKEVTIFLLMDGAGIGKKGNAKGVKHPEFERLDHLMEDVIKAGATVYVCELSAKFRGIGADDLVEGVRLAGAATYLELLSNPANAVVNF